MGCVKLYHIGPQKSGTTWVYKCLSEHPGVAVPKSDSIHYFDIHYHKGRDWFYSHFDAAHQDCLLLDPTPSYLRSPLAPERIAREAGDARIALTMRHPLSRAFSHYWHEKKKGRFNFEFGECLKNYDLFANWIEPGFYSRHIERYMEHFSQDQILPQLYDTLEADPSAFLGTLVDFYGMEGEFSPSVLNERINVARPAESRILRATEDSVKRMGKRVLQTVGMGRTVPHARRLLTRPRAVEKGKDISRGRAPKMEYLTDQPPAILDDLMALCLPEIERLERTLGIDLEVWRTLPVPKRMRDGG